MEVAIILFKAALFIALVFAPLLLVGRWLVKKFDGNHRPDDDLSVTD